MQEKLLSVNELVTEFRLDDGVLRAVDHVSFDLARGETLGIVGESGCGKSVTAFSILNLISRPGRIVGGEVIFEGKELGKLSKKELRQVRGSDIAMIFQEPMTSLNPVYTVGEQISEALRLHKKLNRASAKEKTIQLLSTVKIPEPARRFNEYPHQLSGGMRQRVMIAMALACDPKLLICDEPTTALDVTVQAQILRLIHNLKRELGMSVILITHDLAVISEIADRVIVMYAGRIVEECDGERIFTAPLHPYTEALLKSIPSTAKQGERLYMIKGMVPNLLKKNCGCMFAPRCEYACNKCYESEPPLFRLDGRSVRCWRHAEKEGERE